MAALELLAAASGLLVLVVAIYFAIQTPRSSNRGVSRRAGRVAASGLVFAASAASIGFALSGFDTNGAAFQVSLTVGALGLLPGTFYIWRYDWQKPDQKQ